MPEILLVTTHVPPGYKVKQIFGVVTGVTSRTRGIGGQFLAGLQSIGGGEVSAYTSEIEKARFEAIERMKEKAIGLGANAIVGIDFETADLGTAIIVITATGTAMVLEKGPE